MSCNLTQGELMLSCSLTQYICIMTSKKRVQTYVPDSTYRWLESVAAKEGISVSQAVLDLISTVEAGGIFSRPAFDDPMSRDELNDMFASFMREVYTLVGSEVTRQITAIALHAETEHASLPATVDSAKPTNKRRSSSLKNRNELSK